METTSLLLLTTAFQFAGKLTIPRHVRLRRASHRDIIIHPDRLMLLPNPLRITHTYQIHETSQAKA